MTDKPRIIVGETPPARDFHMWLKPSGENHVLLVMSHDGVQQNVLLFSTRKGFMLVNKILLVDDIGLPTDISGCIEINGAA